jgi:hypothetical protein
MASRRKSRSILPTGEQEFKVIDAREQKSQCGNEMIVLLLMIAETWGIFAREYLVFTHGGHRNIDRFLAAIGKHFADGDEIRGHDLLRCTGRAVVDISIDPEKQRKKHYYVVKWLPANSTALQTGATADPRPGEAS